MKTTMTKKNNNVMRKIRAKWEAKKSNTLKGELGGGNLLNLYGEIDYDAQAEVSDFLQSAEGEVVVAINSPGGYADCGVGIYNMLKEYKGDITTRVYGMAASSAGIIALAGDKREAFDSASFMLHNAWTFALGNADELRALANDLDVMDAGFRKAVMSASGMKEADAKELLAKGEFMTAETALDKGFVSCIIKDEKVNEVLDWTQVEVKDGITVNYGGLT